MTIECPHCHGYGFTHSEAIGEYSNGQKIIRHTMCPDCKGWGFVVTFSHKKVTKSTHGGQQN